MLKSRFVVAPFQFITFEGADDDAAAAATKAAADKAAADAAALDAKNKTVTMTQAALDEIILKRSEQARNAQKITLAQMEALKETLQMNDTQKAAYEAELEELRKRTMTAEEIRKRELKQKEDELGGKLKTAETAAAKWKSAHDSLIVDFEITQAGAEAKVVAGLLPVISAYLKPQTRLVEEKDAQGAVSRYIPTIDFNDVGADGKPVVSTLTVKDAVLRMRELPAYASVFEGTARSGAGAASGHGANGKPIDWSKVSGEEFAKLRKENPQAVYGK